MIYINFDFVRAGGGGKVFLKSLKNHLKSVKLYCGILKAKYVILNSHHRPILALIYIFFF